MPGPQTATPAGWFDCLGSKIPEEQRRAAACAAREMGVGAEYDTQWVHETAEYVEADRPGKAIETVRDHLDLTGTYRFLATLCTPREEWDDS